MKIAAVSKFSFDVSKDRKLKGINLGTSIPSLDQVYFEKGVNKGEEDEKKANRDKNKANPSK